MRVSSRSNTSVYLSFSSSPSGFRNGGETFGKFAKLFGKTAVAGDAIAEALRMAKGFFPVREV